MIFGLSLAGLFAGLVTIIVALIRRNQHLTGIELEGKNRQQELSIEQRLRASAEGDLPGAGEGAKNVELHSSADSHGRSSTKWLPFVLGTMLIGASAILLYWSWKKTMDAEKLIQSRLQILESRPKNGSFDTVLTTEVPEELREELKQIADEMTWPLLNGDQRALEKMALGDYEAARELLTEKTAEERAASFNRSMHLAKCYLFENNYPAATDQYTRALEAFPDNVAAHNGLVIALIANGNANQAVDPASAACGAAENKYGEKSLDYALALNNLGGALFRSGLGSNEGNIKKDKVLLRSISTYDQALEVAKVWTPSPKKAIARIRANRAEPRVEMAEEFPEQGSLAVSDLSYAFSAYAETRKLNPYDYLQIGNNLATTYMKLARKPTDTGWRLADNLFMQLVPFLKRNEPIDAKLSIALLSNASRAAQSLQALPRSREYAIEAVRIGEKRHAHGAEFAGALLQAGHTATKSDTEARLQFYRRSLAAFRAHFKVRFNPTITNAQLYLAEALKSTPNGKAESRSLAEEVISELERVGALDRPAGTRAKKLIN